MKKCYQILSKGIFSNQLYLYETESFEEFNSMLGRFRDGKYPNLWLLDTNFCNL